MVAGVHEHGWAHHIQRLMVLGNFALEHGWSPAETTEWFTGAFVDGTSWVMPTNVVGMSLHADGGVVATKPYASGGAYIDRMTDYCGGCRFDPKVRVGEDACPFTAGYWAFLDEAPRDALGQPADGAAARRPRPAEGPRRAPRAGAPPHPLVTPPVCRAFLAPEPRKAYKSSCDVRRR